jgi:hypothetical protein
MSRARACQSIGGLIGRRGCAHAARRVHACLMRFHFHAALSLLRQQAKAQFSMRDWRRRRPTKRSSAPLGARSILVKLKESRKDAARLRASHQPHALAIASRGRHFG